MNYKIIIKPLEDSRIEIDGELTADVFESYREHAVRHLGETIKLDGFRPGHIPESILVERLGEGTILEEMANDALGELYPMIVTEHKLEIIGRPEVSITKIAKNNPLGFKIVTAVLPEIILPDYKKIAHEAKTELKQDKFEGENNVESDKELAASFRLRNAIVEKILKSVEVKLPQVLVEREIDRRLDELKAEASHYSISFDIYLKTAKKTEVELRQEWRLGAEKSVLGHLVLLAIAKAEAIRVPEDELTVEVDKLLKIYPSANKDSARLYLEEQLAIEHVFQKLESF